MNADQTISGLQQVQASATVFYQKLRFFHWVVKGRDFFELHRQFEDLYDRWNTFIDDVAERVVQLGGRPVPTLAQLVKDSAIIEASDPLPAAAMVRQIADDLRTQCERLDTVRAAADKAGDSTTVNLIDPATDQIAKDIWMFEAYLAD